MKETAMAELRSPQDTGVNWSVVGVGIILLMLVVIAIPDAFLRALVSAIIMFGAVFLAQSRAEPQLESPVLDQLHRGHDAGLDRRKYGHLRKFTSNLLDYVREMNKIAVEGREGKLAPRHAQAELERIAAKMRETVDDIRKTAGVPTPMEATSKEKPVQPRVVIPKPTREAEPREAAPPPAARPEAPQASRDANEALKELEAKAEAEARKREQREGGD